MTGESTVSRRAFGTYLRELRERRNITRLSAGLIIETSPQTLMRLEDGGSTKISTPQLERLLEHYDADQDSKREALGLWSEVLAQAKASKAQGNSRGFWVTYSDQYDAHFEHYLRHEQAAHQITTHQLVLFPGLLQTANYRRSIARIEDPDISKVNMERRIELAERRQNRLDDNSFRLGVFISEAVLRHRPGGPDVMSEQLAWINETGERHNVSIRVIPQTVVGNPGLLIQSFTLLEFREQRKGLPEPPVIYLEGAVTGNYHQRTEVIDKYRAAISELEAVALAESDTRDLVSRVQKEYSA